MNAEAGLLQGVGRGMRAGRAARADEPVSAAEAAELVREPQPAVAQDRDERLAALFSAEYAGLCRLAALLIGDRARAEELVMDAFASTVSGWRRIRDVDAAPAYLRRAVVNACRNAQARRGREWAANAMAQAGTLTASGMPEDVSHVLAAIADLPPRQRAAIVLTFYVDLTESEVAAALGCRPGTVKSQLSKARANLARALSESESTESEAHRG